MMSETVVTVHETTTHTTGNNPRQVPTVKTEPGQNPGFTLNDINTDYFRNKPGMLKVAQLLLGLIAMICVGAPYRLSSAHWFLFVGSVAFIITFFLIVIYAFNLRESTKYPLQMVLSWEVMYTAGITFFYFTGCLAVLISYSGYRGNGSAIAGGVFGLLTTVAYGLGSFLLFTEYKAMTSQ
ncbi:CKLF-like MARVEL transmembrane domain-containing protein 4 [Leptopilina heterotoma]|uniref:CKLF-like MARVEL transmembrane domain-containing protein 4 n=1 Tax=Leptopilina heterotoma TaxID=63436 RepID=UPI001CA93BBA|nr:CKLF-like MARVEL transmembrane domain-containing protein 4 [Leptopilina heterotoma]